MSNDDFIEVHADVLRLAMQSIDELREICRVWEPDSASYEQRQHVVRARRAYLLLVDALKVKSP